MPLPAGAALRQVCGETLAELARHDPRILVLDGDVGSSTGAAIFETAHPQRYIQAGPAAQNMMAVAAGLAPMGFQPHATTFPCFAVAPALESVRGPTAQPRLNVKIIGGYPSALL